MDLDQAAKRLGDRLRDTRQRIVFAESCTGGLAAAALTGIPGISEWFCGSAVTYREATKQAWLEIDPNAIKQHSAESRIVTEQMAQHVLARTAEADMGVAVTGHLGPNVPSEVDGVIFVSIASRAPAGATIQSHRVTLHSRQRASRQREAAAKVLQLATGALGSV